MKKYGLKISAIAFILSLALGCGIARAAMAAPNLSITMTDQTGYVNVGQNIVYTVSINNTGTAAAANVDLKAIIPDTLTYVSDTSGTTPVITQTTYVWSFGKIKAGDNRSFEIIFSTDQLAASFAPEQVGLVDSSASVSTTTAVANKKNASTTVETFLLPPLPDQTQVI